jgi:hypothetical protein
MQIKIILTDTEVRKFMQQAELINNGNSLENRAIVLTIDDNRIAVDVADASRSIQREIVAECNHPRPVLEPVNDHNGH